MDEKFKNVKEVSDFCKTAKTATDGSDHYFRVMKLTKAAKKSIDEVPVWIQ